MSQSHASLYGDARTQALKRFNLGDRAFHLITKASALAVLVLLGGVIISLIHGSAPALGEFGFGFLTSQSWNPVTEKFGAAPAIYGTLLTSFLALLIAAPVGFGIAVFLTEICPYPAAPAHRRRHRAARRHSLDHLRHLGHVRARAGVAGDLAALADRQFRRHSHAEGSVRRAALRHRHFHGLDHSRRS